MSLQTWQESLITSQVDGTALANSTVATSIIPAAARFTLPANFFQIGRKLKIVASGRISTTTGPPTFTFDVRLGAVIVFNGGAVTTVASVTNLTWELMIELTCRAIGAGTTANLMGTGRLTSAAVVGSTGGAANSAMLPASAPAVGTGFDSTSSQIVELFGTWSAASASNTVQVHEYELIAPN